MDPGANAGLMNRSDPGANVSVTAGAIFILLEPPRRGMRPTPDYRTGLRRLTWHAVGNLEIINWRCAENEI